MSSEPPEGVEMDENKGDDQDSPKGGAGHASLLRQAVNNRSEDTTRVRPTALKSSGSSSNPTKTPPAVRSHSVSGEGLRTPSPKPRGGLHRSHLRNNQGRENSPAPNLADLEFPPPPPPLDDDVLPVSGADEAASESSRTSSERRHPSTPRGQQQSQLKIASAHIQLRASSVDRVVPNRTGPPPPPPPATQKNGEDQFFLGEEVSVEENSLKKNIDSSRTGRDVGRNDSPNTTAESANSGGLPTSKSVDSISSSDFLERNSIGPHQTTDEPDSGGGRIMSQSIFGILRSPSWDGNLDTPPDLAPPPVPKNKPTTPRGFQRQTDVHPTEAKDRADLKLVSGGSSTENLTCPANPPPSVHLVSELFENLRLKAGKKPGSATETQTDHSATPPTDMAPPPRPTHPAPSRSLNNSTQSANKKFDLKAADSNQHDGNHSQTTVDAGPKFDFKSRLRKVGNDGKPSEPEPSPIKSTAPQVETKTDKSADSSDDLDDKRKSSGSINSLKRMWEKDQQQRISGSKPTTASSESVPTTKPPPLPQQLPDKPAVPVKPSNVVVMKPLGKSSSAAIYATPNSSVINASSPASKPPVPSSGSRNSTVYAKGSSMVIPSSGNGEKDSGGEERQKILTMCSEAEQVLSQSHSTPTQWMDKLASLHSQCHTYADSIAPHGRFHFRQLIAKLESQTKEMKQTSSTGPLRNSSEHSRLIGDVKNTVRDLANALQR